MRDIVIGIALLIGVCMVLQVLAGMGWLGILVLLGFGAWYNRERD